MALSQQQIDAIERPGYVAPVFPTTKKAGVGSATKPKTSTASGGSSTPTVTAPPVYQTPTIEQTALDKAATQPKPYALSTIEQDRLDKQAAVQISPVTGVGNQKSAQELATEQAMSNKAASNAQKTAQLSGGTSYTPATTEGLKQVPEASETESSKLMNEAIQNVNSQIQNISNEKFDYNPLADSLYLRDAANLENQITQMMVGRGGIYSSVAQNALSSQMINLQNNYIQNKYTEFKDSRNFQLQMAQQNFENAMTIVSAKNTQEQQALDQMWKQLQFQVDQEERAYQRQQTMNEYNLKVAQLNYEMQSAQAQAEAQQNIANVQAQYALYADSKKNLESAVSKWIKTGTSDASIKSAFEMLGITIPVGANYNYYGTQITNAYLTLANMESNLKNAAVEANNTIEILDLLDALNNPTIEKKITEYTYDGEERTGQTTYTVNVPVSEAFKSSKGMQSAAVGASAVK